MTYFISGHRDITPEEFEKFYVPAIVDVIDTCDNNYDDCEFVVGDCRGCDEMAANFIANYIKENTDDTECPPCILCIYHTDYRSALPYEVIMDKGDCVWVAGCTIQNVDTEVYIEEYSADVENEVSPDKDILENGFSRQVTFYEKD